MKLSRLAWAVWAIVPVAALAFHYGPGQRIYLHDRAVDLQHSATRLESEALELQHKAYAAHLVAVEARRQASASPSPEAESRATAATAAESTAFQASSSAWRLVADAYSKIQGLAQDSSPETLRKIRWSRSRALVRAGDIWSGISELESILDETERAGLADSEMARTTREELGAAYYYGARLMRLSGDPPAEWMVESGKARQHFRYLAEQARAKGLGKDVVEDQERNVELVLNLEQSTLVEIQGKPLPKDSPLGRTGPRPGNRPGKRKQPPQQRDGRGAGGAEEIYTGW